MKRYDISTAYVGADDITESPDGEWVKWEDVERLSDLEERVDFLAARLGYLEMRNDAAERLEEPNPTVVKDDI